MMSVIAMFQQLTAPIGAASVFELMFLVLMAYPVGLLRPS
jgi:hypothetical protein